MPANAKKAIAMRAVAIPPIMILPMGEIDAEGKDPDVRSGFNIVINIIYRPPLLTYCPLPVVMM
jgi:hypothetical protein